MKIDERALKYLFTHSWSYNFDGGYYVNGPFFDSNKEFCISYGGVRTTFEWAQQFPCGGSSPNNECWGLTTATDGIFLEYSGNSWAHELIHVYEGQQGILNTADHPNWDLKGYYYFNDTLWNSIMQPGIMSPPDGGSPYPPYEGTQP